MHAPVLVIGPTTEPVRLDEMKLHLRVDSDDEDTLIQGLISAAVTHMDGWPGILGRALVEQTWRQDFDRLRPCLRLPLGPVSSIAEITVRSRSGATSTVDSSAYELQVDDLGAFARFVDDYAFPVDLYETRAVSVTYIAGHPDDEPAEGEQVGASTVPAPIRTAMKMLVAHWYQNREAINVGNITTELPLSVAALLAPLRRVGI